MCEDGAWCVSEATARSWWGSPLLLPRGSRASWFVAQDRDGRFGVGEGERDLPHALSLVLTYGGPGANRVDQNAVIASGGIVIRAIRRAQPPDPRMTAGRQVPVRGTTGTIGESTSMTTATKHRTVLWTVRDGSAFVMFVAFDDPAYRSLDELVHVLDALGEA